MQLSQAILQYSSISNLFADRFFYWLSAWTVVKFGEKTSSLYFLGRSLLYLITGHDASRPAYLSDGREVGDLATGVRAT